VLNIYYTTGDGFELPQFPDATAQWRENSDWLKLAFHAYANEPARPYQTRSRNTDCRPGEGGPGDPPLRRSGDLHSAHGDPLGMVQPAALKPMAERGVRGLTAYFQRVSTGWDVNYLFDDGSLGIPPRHDA